MASANFFDFHAQVTQRRVKTAERAEPTQPPLTVSQLANQVKAALKGALPPSVRVRGEVSGCRRVGASQHTYLKLKDAETDACIECVLYRSDAANVKFEIDDGLEVVATGRIDSYIPKSQYQLVITRMEPVGRGSLELAYRQMCARLEAEGLFAPERKKKLPVYPGRIAIITSRDAAALQDVLKVMRAFPWLQLFLFHVPVQGNGAEIQIAQAIECIGNNCDAIGGVDVILLTRGGGSLEDLWCFNEECVARAAAGCPVPIITGIGHQTDVSVVDHVADYWAHTPTEAARILTERWAEARPLLTDLGQSLDRGVLSMIQDAKRSVLFIEKHELFRRPRDLVNQPRQRLDESEKTLRLGMTQRVAKWQGRLDSIGRRLEAKNPQHARRAMHLKLDGMAIQLDRAIRNDLRRCGDSIEATHKRLEALSPENVLRRGYSLTTRKKDGKLIRAAGELKPGERIVTRFADGEAESMVEDRAQPPLFE